jgi:beta-N-acetylhexosaminidase
MVLSFFSKKFDIIIYESNILFYFQMMSQTIEQLIGQLIIAGFRGKDAEPTSPIAKFIKNFNLAGVILYDEDLGIGGLRSRNIESPNQVKSLTTQLQSYSEYGLLISIDQEGGLVNRLKSDYGFHESPSWQHFGMLNNNLITQQFSETLSSTLQNAGINLNFAPVLDLDFGKDTVIGKSGRAFSNNPQTVVNHAKIFIQKLKENRIISCGKHFPGQGSASGDTHEGYTDISDSWTVKDLIPFDELIQSKDLDMIMVSHTFDDKLDKKFPSSLSKEIITGTLRNDLGFDGVVICDDPSMKAISEHYNLEDSFELMLNAGVDLFCLGNNLNYDPDYIPKVIDAICHLVKIGKISENRLLDSIKRIDSLKKKYNIHGK